MLGTLLAINIGYKIYIKEIHFFRTPDVSNWTFVKFDDFAHEMEG